MGNPIDSFRMRVIVSNWSGDVVQNNSSVFYTEPGGRVMGGAYRTMVSTNGLTLFEVFCYVL